MRKNSLRIAPVSAILPINSIQKHLKNSSDTWSNISTGAHWKWSLPALKLKPQETLLDKSCDTEVLVSKNSVSDMLTLLKTSRLWLEKHDSKTKKIDRTVSKQMTNAYSEIGNIAKEQARAILPEGNTVSRLYMNGTLRSWVHFIELRSGHGTQKEHREVARACAEVIAQVFPMITEFVNGEDNV
jgi:thymidylate synthase ThyX